MSDNPFLHEENLTPWLEQDQFFQTSKQMSLNTFKSKHGLKPALFMSVQNNYLKFAHFVTRNAILATVLMVMTLTAVSASAAQLIAPTEYKPATILGFEKAASSVSAKATYRNPQFPNFSFDYPLDWQISDQNESKDGLINYSVFLKKQDLTLRFSLVSGGGVGGGGANCKAQDPRISPAWIKQKYLPDNPENKEHIYSYVPQNQANIKFPEDLGFDNLYQIYTEYASEGQALLPKEQVKFCSSGVVINRTNTNIPNLSPQPDKVFLFVNLSDGGHPLASEAEEIIKNVKIETSLEENSASSSASSASSSSVSSSSSASSSSAPAQIKLEGTKYVGKVGDSEVEMYLNWKADKFDISGGYLYKSQNKPIELKGRYDAGSQLGSIFMEEFVDGQKTGEFGPSGDGSSVIVNADFVKNTVNTIKGKWKNAKTNQELPFEVKKEGVSAEVLVLDGKILTLEEKNNAGVLLSAGEDKYSLTQAQAQGPIFNFYEKAQAKDNLKIWGKAEKKDNLYILRDLTKVEKVEEKPREEPLNEISFNWPLPFKGYTDQGLEFQACGANCMTYVANKPLSEKFPKDLKPGENVKIEGKTTNWSAGMPRIVTFVEISRVERVGPVASQSTASQEGEGENFTLEGETLIYSGRDPRNRVVYKQEEKDVLYYFNGTPYDAANAQTGDKFKIWGKGKKYPNSNFLEEITRGEKLPREVTLVNITASRIASRDEGTTTLSNCPENKEAKECRTFHFSSPETRKKLEPFYPIDSSDKFMFNGKFRTLSDKKNDKGQTEFVYEALEITYMKKEERTQASASSQDKVWKNGSLILRLQEVKDGKAWAAGASPDGNILDTKFYQIEDLPADFRAKFKDGDIFELKYSTVSAPKTKLEVLIYGKHKTNVDYIVTLATGNMDSVATSTLPIQHVPAVYLNN